MNRGSGEESGLGLRSFGGWWTSGPLEPTAQGPRVWASSTAPGGQRVLLFADGCFNERAEKVGTGERKCLSSPFGERRREGGHQKEG